MTCYSAAKPKHNYCTEPTPSRTRALQQRGVRNDKPAHQTKSSPCWPQLEEFWVQQQRPRAAKTFKNLQNE